MYKYYCMNLNLQIIFDNLNVDANVILGLKRGEILGGWKRLYNVLFARYIDHVK
jgi:hypothetical protein